MRRVTDHRRALKWQGSRERREIARRRSRVLRRRRSAPIFLDPSLIANVRAPEIFMLERPHAHAAVCAFLKELRQACKAGDRVVVVNFRRTRKVFAGAMLLFYAELTRLQALYPHAQWDCIPSPDATVNQVLKFLSVFSRLGYESSVVPTRKDVVSWRHTSDTLVDGRKSGQLLEMYKGLSRDETRHTFRGVAEATTNVVHHAYIAARRDGLPDPAEKRWWMFCRESDDSLYVSVCDLGVGIPGSLPVRFDGELISKAIELLGGQTNDGRMIQAAIEIARTRTDRAGRGKGLGDLKKVVDEVPGTRLYIFSNRGLVEYWGGKETVRNFENSIRGTLIVWILPLKGKSHD